MRGIKFRAFLKLDEYLLDVGSATATTPDEIVHMIEERRDAGEIDVEDGSEIWVVPADSVIRRTAVGTASTSTGTYGDSEGDEYEYHYKSDEDRKFGDDYLALTQTDETTYEIDGTVRAVEFETATRLAASLKDGRMDAKEVVLIPRNTVNDYVIGSDSD
ncbi:hypothetical protein ACEU6E_06840 [Halorutilales archaeon Cl-col2-1]